MRQSSAIDDAAGVVLVARQRVQEVEEALVGQVVRGELLDRAAGQEAEVGGDAKQAGGDAVRRRLGPVA